MDASVDATVDGNWPDAGKPAARWVLLSGNAASDRTIPTDPQPTEQLVLYVPDGSGGYKATWRSEEKDWVRSLAWADFDGDGDLDFVAGHGMKSARRLRVYRNEGNETFVAAWTAPTPAFTPAVQWIDYDKDGRQDIIAAAGKIIRLYRNVDGKVFVESDLVSGGFNDFWELDAADIDKDGDIDVAVATSEGPRVYENNNGILGERWRSPVVENCGAVAWADYDGDGFLDLGAATGNAFAVYHQGNDVFVRSFDGGKDMHPTLPAFSVSAIEWVDYDGDGDVDLAVASQRSPEGGGATLPDRVRVFKNTGGSFSVGWESDDVMLANSLVVADYDNDGDPDLAIGVSGPDVVFENTGRARFVARWSSGTSDLTDAISWAPFPMQ